jgi:DNA-binding NarL/FixJ family response regulator
MATHLARRPLQRESVRPRISPHQERPTTAEWDVLMQLEAGRSNAEIASARDRSKGTVAKQVGALFRKFGVSSRRALASRVSQTLPHEPALPTLARTSGSEDGEPILSPREYEVVGFAVLGQSNKAIAYELGLSPSTVGVLLRRAAAKLGVRTAAELIREYQRLRHP